MYIIAASLLGNFALNIYAYFAGPEAPFSNYTFQREALVVEEVLPNSAGDRAGIQAGDRVLAIERRRVLGLGQWDAIRINFEVGKAYRFQVERDGKQVERDGKQFERVMTLQRRSWALQTRYRRIAFVLDTASALLTLFVAFRVYATLRLGSPDWRAVHCVAGGILFSLWHFRHRPADADFGGCAHLVAHSRRFYISCAFLCLLLDFPAQIVPISLDLGGPRAISFLPVAHRWFYLHHICEPRGRPKHIGLGSTARCQSPVCLFGRRLGCADCELPTLG